MWAYIFCIHFSVEGHLGSFQLLVIINKAAMNIVEPVSLPLVIIARKPGLSQYTGESVIWGRFQWMQDKNTSELRYMCSIAVSWEALPVPDKYRGGCSQPSTGLSTGSPLEELERKDPRSWRIFQPHRRNNNTNQPVPSELPGTKPPTKLYT